MHQHLERLNGLDPKVAQNAALMIRACEHELGRRLLVTQGWRSLDDQMLIYQKGRAVNRETGEWEVVDTAKIVTKAKPGASPHNVVDQDGTPASLAFDVIPFHTEDGSIDWNPGMTFWAGLYTIAWKCSLDPLGDPIGAYYPADKGHFELPNWKTRLIALGYHLPSMV